VATVKRYDRGELSKPVRQPNGWLRADAYLSRSGVFLYRNPDGSERREYRPPDEVFKADTLESFALVPLTNDHPAEGMLTAENTRQYQVGTVVAPRQDAEFMRSQLLVTDAATIADMESGKVELSCGYCADLDETPGVTPEGERYDARQMNIRGNHVAVVAAGRAGPDVRVRMDAADRVMVASTHKADSDRNRTEQTMKIRFDQAELEVTEDVAKAIAAERTAHEAALKGAKDEAAKVAARADVAEGELKKVKAELEAAPAKIRESLTARMELEATVKAAVPEVKTDGVSDLDLRKAFIVARLPDMKLDGKDEAYVAAAFDLAKSKKDEEPVTRPIRRDGVDGASPDLEAARKAYFAALPK
jgi:hypothetical protein